MSQVVLSDTQTNDGTEMGEEWEGFYQAICSTYSSTVSLQVATGEESTFFDMYCNGEKVEFERKGDSFDLHLAKGFIYKFTTSSAGSVIEITRHRG